jgi:hypothetical protein
MMLCGLRLIARMLARFLSLSRRVTTCVRSHDRRAELPRTLTDNIRAARFVAAMARADMSETARISSSACGSRRPARSHAPANSFHTAARA